MAQEEQKLYSAAEGPLGSPRTTRSEVPQTAIEQLTAWQKEIGYKENEGISPVALLGIAGEAGEVLAECDIHIISAEKRSAGAKQVVIDAECIKIIQSARYLEHFKKSIRSGERTASSEVTNNFLPELADLLYYINIAAFQAGSSLEQLAAMALAKGKQRNTDKTIK